MFEHLDPGIPPVHLLTGASFAEIDARTRMVRRRQNMIAATLTVSLLCAGTASGLTLGGPSQVHAPIGKGPLFALGDPQSTSAEAPLPALATGSVDGAPTCPTNAAVHAGFAAASVTSPGPIVVGTTTPTGTGTTGAVWSPTGTPVDSVAAGGTTGSGDSRPVTSTSTSTSTGHGGTPHPVVGPGPSSPSVPTIPLPGGGGTTVPVDPSTPPLTTPPSIDPGGGTTDPGTIDEPPPSPTDSPVDDSGDGGTGTTGGSGDTGGVGGVVGTVGGVVDGTLGTVTGG